MSKTKSWLMDMDEHIADAFESGAYTEQDVVAYCKHHMELPIDEQYIKQTWKIYTGEST
jgi:hypothetical protein